MTALLSFVLGILVMGLLVHLYIDVQLLKVFRELAEQEKEE